MVEAGVSQDELRQILSQLRSYSQSTAPPPAPAPSVKPSYPGSYPQSYGAQPSYANQNPQPAYPPSYPQQTKAEPMDLASILAAAQNPSTSTPTTAAPAVPAINNITNLFNSLVKAGVVSATGTPTGAGETAKTEENSDPTEALKASARQYRKMILSQNVKLTSAGITK